MLLTFVLQALRVNHMVDVAALQVDMYQSAFNEYVIVETNTAVQ